MSKSKMTLSISINNISIIFGITFSLSFHKIILISHT